MARPSRLRTHKGNPDYLPEGPSNPDIDGMRLMIRVAFGRRGALGPGKMRLLEMIDQHGSITGACRDMGMSYRRAWLLVEGLKKAFRQPVLATQQGGSSGGGCSLTPYGLKVLQRYRALEQKARLAVHKELQAFSEELLLGAEVDSAPVTDQADKPAA